MSLSEQIDIFQKQAGRQLLVAMIQATSGERFDEKIDSECRDLGNELGLIYAIVALATSLRVFITTDELLTAIGESSNESLNRIQSLIRQRLIVEKRNELRLRHRVVADRALEYYQRNGQLTEPIEGLLWSMATRVFQYTPRHDREARLRIRLLNHDFLMTTIPDIASVRRIYNTVESLSAWDYHYFLQRGSFEVEMGDLNLAQNFLDSARSMAGDDYLVQI